MQIGDGTLQVNNFYGNSTPALLPSAPVKLLPPLKGDEIARALLDQVVDALLGSINGTIGLTTGLIGTGGFGKTTMALMASHDQRVQEEFDDFLWVTVGDEVDGSALAAKITALAQQFVPGLPTVTEPLAAGALLGRVLDDRRALLVIDDVWTRSQVEPFLLGANRTVRLFTTRQRNILPRDSTSVVVDQMGLGEAAELVSSGLSSLSPRVIAEALEATGRWPVLLSLVNGAVGDAAAAGAEAESELRDVLAALRSEGITA